MKSYNQCNAQEKKAIDSFYVEYAGKREHVDHACWTFRKEKGRLSAELNHFIRI